jgi:acylphosphatase
VRNLSDGSVEAVAEGDEKALDEFIEWCHHGPQNAVVKKVETQNIPVANFVSFEVRR